MELFAVTLAGMPGASFASLERCLRQSVRELRARSGTLRWELDEERRTVTCVSGGRKPSAARLAGLAACMADAAAEYMMAELEPAAVRRIIADEYGGERQEERDGITAYSLKTLAGSASPEARAARLRRKRRMADELKACLSEYRTVSLDGFARFRLGAHRRELREIVEEAAQEYMMDRQYREFISLLRYVVDVRETRIPVVHLIHRATEAALEMFDARFRPLELAAETKLNAPVRTSDAEDLVVSALITAAPRRIVVHSRQPAAPVIRTIEGIFGGRVRVCRSCSSCAPHFSFSGVPET